FLVLCVGFGLSYRAAAKQLDLTAQQQDFVSAVSHELKTPLTSIRMYGEMLKEGWANEARKQEYYAYILTESERLSRLINNVLQLASMTRNDLRVDLVKVDVDVLLTSLQETTASQLSATGFNLEVNLSSEAAGMYVQVDTDFATQIVINLLDNAIKFSSRTDGRTIVLGAEKVDDETVELFVRDFGPGIDRDQMRKIFGLFYRSENELTRETVGTGIGLALVHQLAQAMGAQVDVANLDPGARFSLACPGGILANSTD
ncbi:MAG: HAMP domain-containing histidine kinase, partial [Chromatiales bacterium]|nr:HAMP domain-containing histidine kinase [Chromatiales bacterium]